MDRHILFYLVGRIILVNGLSLIIPLTAGLLWGERGLLYFGPSLIAAVALAFFCLYRGRHHKRQVGAGEGAWYMVLVWLALSLLGMVPYLIAGVFTSPADAFFESTAAFTTTGTSVLADGGAALPSSLLLWHSLMGWLGGLNFILMLVSVMPLVSGCFGLTLSVHQSVSFSPMVASMQDAARKVGCIYLAITMFSIFLYWLAGLSPTAAVNQALLTLSTSGGDSLFDFFRYDSRALEGAAALSMLLASGNFLLYWKGWERRSLKIFLHDAELRYFLMMFLGVSAVVSFHLWHYGVYDGWDNLRYGFFQVLSFISTSGFASTSMESWPEFDKYVLFLLAFIGGCIGSSTGGLKVMRFMVLFKMTSRELQRTLHPHMVVSLKIDGVPVDMKIVSRVLSYFFLVIMTFFASMLIISLAGVTPIQAMAMAVGCLSSVGSTMALFGVTDVASLPAWTKVYCGFLMILGRIEIFPALLVIQHSVSYVWRRW